MRENTRSLGLYFMLVGGIGLLFNGLSFLGVTANLALGLLTVFSLLMQGISFVLSAASLWIGMNLARLLITRPQLPLRFAALSLAVSALTFNILGVLLNVYIWYQLKRLAQEAEIPPEPRVLE